MDLYTFPTFYTATLDAGKSGSQSHADSESTLHSQSGNSHAIRPISITSQTVLRISSGTFTTTTDHFMSNLRSPAVTDQFRRFSNLYVSHRPFVQRFLTVSFIFYVLGSTYRGLSARPSTSKSKQKGKGDGNEGQQTGKPARVAVRSISWHTPSCHL